MAPKEKAAEAKVPVLKGQEGVVSSSTNRPTLLSAHMPSLAEDKVLEYLKRVRPVYRTQGKITED